MPHPCRILQTALLLEDPTRIGGVFEESEQRRFQLDEKNEGQTQKVYLEYQLVTLKVKNHNQETDISSFKPMLLGLSKYTLLLEDLTCTQVNILKSSNNIENEVVGIYTYELVDILPNQVFH